MFTRCKDFIIASDATENLYTRGHVGYIFSCFPIVTLDNVVVGVIVTFFLLLRLRAFSLRAAH